MVRFVTACAGSRAAIGDAASESVIDEEFEGVVDGRETDPRIGFTHGGVEFFCGWVGFGGAECFVDQQPWLGAADRAADEDVASRG